MATLEIQGKTFEVDGDGFLTDPSIWNEDVAKLFAEADGITELNDKHWAIIKIIRDNFEEKEKLADNYQKVYTELNEVYMENEKIMNRLERENGL